MEWIVEIITPSLPYKKKRVRKRTNIGTKRWGIKRIVDRVQPTLHKKKKKRTIYDRKQNGEVQVRMHKGRWRTAMGRNLEDASEGSTTPSATRIQETLPCSIDAFSCMTTFHSSATATRATCALTELRTRTRTPHRTTRKRNVSRMTPTTQSTEREDGVFRHRFTRLHVAVLGSLKPMLSDFLDLLLDRGERFRSCPRSSVAKMWTARNTIHLTFKAMRQKHRTTWNIAAHSCEVPLHMLLHKHTDPQKKKKKSDLKI